MRQPSTLLRMNPFSHTLCVDEDVCTNPSVVPTAFCAEPPGQAAGGAEGGRLPLLGALALATLPGVAVKQLINCVQLRMAAQALIARDRRAASAGPGGGLGGGSGGLRRTRDKGVQP